jgi:hypothetical protein
VKDANRNSEPLDAILRRAMREPPGAATPECADAESLAAYWDRSMPAPDRERFETHLADCARCQMQLAAIARADESAREASAEAEIPWYRRWGFAIPALTAAAAIVVFVAIRKPASEPSQSAEVVAMAKREAPAASAPMPQRATAPEVPVVGPLAPTAVAPPSNEIAMNETRRAEANRAEANSAGRPHRMESLHHPETHTMSESAAPAPAIASAPAEGGRVVAIAPAAPFVAPSPTAQAPQATQPNPSAPSALAMNQPKMEVAQPAPSTGYAPRALQAPETSWMASVPGGPPPANEGATVGQSGAAPGGTAIGAASGAVVGSAAGAAPGSGSAPIIGAGIGHPEEPPPGIRGFSSAAVNARAAGAAGNTSLTATPLASISPPDQPFSWIVGKNGTIQRRDANGAMHAEHSGVTTDLVAGAAPSARVCWIVGRSGTIIRTTDGGQHWTLIAPPAMENLATVSAVSADAATITTAGGRKFATSDGGMSWHPH